MQLFLSDIVISDETSSYIRAEKFSLHSWVTWAWTHFFFFSPLLVWGFLTRDKKGRQPPSCIFIMQLFDGICLFISLLWIIKVHFKDGGQFIDAAQAGTGTSVLRNIPNLFSLLYNKLVNGVCLYKTVEFSSYKTKTSTKRRAFFD